jgi:hypothetical protein
MQDRIDHAIEVLVDVCVGYPEHVEAEALDLTRALRVSSLLLVGRVGAAIDLDDSFPSRDTKSTM